MTNEVNYQVPAGTTFIANIYTTDIDGNYVVLNGGVLELRAEYATNQYTETVVNNIPTYTLIPPPQIDLSSTTPLTDGSSITFPTVSLDIGNGNTVPMNSYAQIQLNPTTTQSFASSELLYQLNFTLSSIVTRLQFGTLTFSQFIPAAS